MELTTLQAYLRVLYTVNSNPQYILAKSASQVPISICGETSAQSATNEPAYARAPLKACLAAVCDSSPELLQDPARDFSLYVLDPLESQSFPAGLAHPSQNTTSPRGVAVALGLMSWALESGDSTNVFVTGTVVPNALPALEVVFALRETKRMPRPILHSCPSFGPIPATSPSQPVYPHPPRVAAMSWYSTPYLQHGQPEQQTLTRSEDFPELYIGPPRRARGRPEGSSSKSKLASQDGGSSVPGASSSMIPGAQSESKQEVGRKSKQKTKSRSPRVPYPCSPFIRAPLTRHATTGGPECATTGVAAFYQQPNPSDQNQTQSHASLYPPAQSYLHPTHHTLLGLLSAIPSTSSGTTAETTPEQQAVLLMALRELLSTNPHLLQLATTKVELPASIGEQLVETKPICEESNAGNEDDGDSDIVVLDSSTIDTTAFRRPSGLGPAASDPDLSSLATNQRSTTPSNHRADCSPLSMSRPPSEKENVRMSSRISAPSVILESTSSVTPDVETLILGQPSSEPIERAKVSTSHNLGTPTPCGTRKRKLDEFVRGQARSTTPVPLPSPSPSVTHASSSGKALAGRQRVQSSPTGGPEPVSSPLTRLPSMLGSMRAMAARVEANSSGSSTHDHSASLTTYSNRYQTTSLVSSSSQADRPSTVDAYSYRVASGTSTLKRRRTLDLDKFMAEHEARIKSSKDRKRSSSGRKSELDVFATESKAAPPQRAKLTSTSRQAQSSPARPPSRSDSVASPSTSIFQPGLVPGTTVISPALPMAGLVSTAPSTATSTAVPIKNPLKNFVLPTWARTSTATLPRLSEEALARKQAEQESRKAQASLRRREAAKAKRQHIHNGERLSKKNLDEDSDAKPRSTHPSSSIARSTPLLPFPPPSLPVFASDAVEPIPSSPPQLRCQLALSNVPSTPPRTTSSLGSGSHRTPSKSGSYSLFTPSEQDLGSLFTPSTPSVTRSLTRADFTPRSPTVFRHSAEKRSSRKGILQPPRTPKRNSGHTPRSLRAGKKTQYGSPGALIRTPPVQTGGTRPFLLPPPSPCALQTPLRQAQSKMLGGSTPIEPEYPRAMKQSSPLDEQDVERDKDRKGDNINRNPDDISPKEDMSIPPEQARPSLRSQDEDGGASEPTGINSNDDASRAEEEYTSSPLPPSSPLDISPLSSPAKHADGDGSTPRINSLSVPDSDILLPSTGNSDGPGGDTSWLPDDACAAAWFRDSEASAWLTETETWLTDTEGGALLTDSDGAWFSDSDAVFGDMSSLPPSSASNWFSDDADGDTDGEAGAVVGTNGGFYAAAFEQAFATLVERAGPRNGKDEGGATQSPKADESAFWETLQPLLGGNLLNSVGTTPRMKESTDEKVAEDLQNLLDGLVDS